MREIKFRAWDGIAERFWTGEEAIKKLVRGYDSDEPTTFYIKGAVYNMSEVTLMQYTGLKDKNGTEIYEGDVVRVWRPTSQRALVEWDKKQARFKLRNKLQLLSIGTRIEVLGNIYENPELLK